MGPKPLPIFPPKSDPKATVASLVVNRALSCTLAPPPGVPRENYAQRPTKLSAVAKLRRGQNVPAVAPGHRFYDLGFARIALEWFRG
jgi:hypothetical protein